MAFKTWTYMELPAPLRVGPGMFDAWRDDCRRGWLLERHPTLKEDDIEVGIEVPPDLDTQISLTALAWVDKLLREEFFEPGRIIQSYRLERRSVLPGKLVVKISILGGPAASPSTKPLAVDEDGPRTEAAE